MSKAVPIQTVPANQQYSIHRSINKPQYACRFADSINRILDSDSHTVDRIRALDVICFVQEKERIRRYIDYNDSAYRLFIQMMGQHFERSPSERKTEVPLMILTETESIFLRRIRKLKKIQKEEYSSKDSQTSSSGISFSKSYMPRSSCQYLQSRLSQKQISQLSEFKSSLIEEGSYHQIFEPEFSSNQSQLNLLRKRASENFNEWLRLSGIKRLAGKPQEKDVKLIEALKTVEEHELLHLIVGDLSHCQSPTPDRPHEIKYELFNNTQNDTYDFRRRQLPVEIRKRVERQLCRYNVMSSVIESFSSSLMSANKKKVRQKAEQWLSDMQQFR